MNNEYRLQLLELVILLLLKKQDYYSYDLVKDVFNTLSLNEGTTYPKITELVIDQLVEPYLKEDGQNEIKKFYRITKDGKMKCEELIQKYTDIKDKIHFLMKGAVKNE